MAPIDLNLLRVFARVLETESFSVAAESLDMPRSTVSRSVAELEAALRLRLFQRTTRSVSSTEAGRELYERVGPNLRALQRAADDLPEQEAEPTGVLRITSTPDLGVVLLAEAAARFTSRYPKAQVDVRLTAAVIDLVRDGIDLALRVTSGKPRDSSLVAQSVGRFAVRLYASPSYVARRGAPRALRDFHAHDRVAFHGKWPNLSPLGPPTGARITCDDMFFAREALRQGCGVGPLPSFIGEPDVACGLLVRVLPKWQHVFGNVALVQPSRQHVPVKVAAFRELLREMLRQRPLVL